MAKSHKIKGGKPTSRKTVLERQKRIDWNLKVINKMIKDHWDSIK